MTNVRLPTMVVERMRLQATQDTVLQQFREEKKAHESSCPHTKHAGKLEKWLHKQKHYIAKHNRLSGQKVTLDEVAEMQEKIHELDNKIKKAAKKIAQYRRLRQAAAPLSLPLFNLPVTHAIEDPTIKKDLTAVKLPTIYRY